MRILQTFVGAAIVCLLQASCFAQVKFEEALLRMASEREKLLTYIIDLECTGNLHPVDLEFLGTGVNAVSQYHIEVSNIDLHYLSARKILNSGWQVTGDSGGVSFFTRDGELLVGKATLLPVPRTAFKARCMDVRAFGLLAVADYKNQQSLETVLGGGVSGGMSNIYMTDVEGILKFESDLLSYRIDTKHGYWCTESKIFSGRNQGVEWTLKIGEVDDIPVPTQAVLTRKWQDGKVGQLKFAFKWSSLNKPFPTKKDAEERLIKVIAEK